MTTTLMLADECEGTNAGATCIDDCIAPTLLPKARWSELESDEEELTNSGGDELCETCSGGTDDIVSVCSRTAHQGDWELPHPLDSVSCSYSSTMVIDDQLLPGHRSSSPSGSRSEGACEQPVASGCAQAALEASPSGSRSEGASDQPLASGCAGAALEAFASSTAQMHYGYNDYVPVWVLIPALPTAWSYGIVPEEQGAHQVGQDARRCSRFDIERRCGWAEKLAPAKKQARKPRGKVHNKIPVGIVNSTLPSACAPSQFQAKVSKRAVTQTQNAQEDPLEERTTLIFRNFPVECTRDVLLDLMDAQGFAGAYDFVHMPVDFHTNFQTKISLGYALVNTVTHNAALCLRQHFQGFDMWPVGDRQPCEVAWNGANQGLAAHIDRYRNSPLMHPSVPEIYRPVLLQDGVRVEFPEPTSKIRPPRIRHQKQVIAGS